MDRSRKLSSFDQNLGFLPGSTRSVLSHRLPAPQPAKSWTAPLFPSLRARLQRRQESGPKPRSLSEFPGRSLAADSRGAGSTRSGLSHPLPAPQPAKSLTTPLFTALRARLQRKLKLDHKLRSISGILGSLPHCGFAGREPHSLSTQSPAACASTSQEFICNSVPQSPGSRLNSSRVGKSGLSATEPGSVGPTSESPPAKGP